MCLPTGLLNFIAKTCTTYVLGFGLYCLYSYAEKGMLSLFSQTIPIFATIMVFLLTALCSCLGLNKRYTCASLCSMFLGTVTFAIVAFLTSLAMEFFDFKKGCAELTKENPLLDLFIDKTIDKYFMETSAVLCSPECPCAWTENTEMLYKKPMNYVVDPQNGARSAIECSGYMSDIQFDMEKQQYLQMMIQLELYGCSGYCEKKDNFSVTNINHGLPKHSCFDVNRLLQKKSLDTVFLGMNLLMWVIILLIPSTCCLMFQRNRQETERQQMLEKVETLKKEFIGGAGKAGKKKDAKKDKDDKKEQTQEQGEDKEDETQEKAEKDSSDKEESEAKDSQQDEKTAEQKKKD